jgi:hypothetical protein
MLIADTELFTCLLQRFYFFIRQWCWTWLLGLLRNSTWNHCLPSFSAATQPPLLRTALAFSLPAGATLWLSYVVDAVIWSSLIWPPDNPRGLASRHSKITKWHDLNMYRINTEKEELMSDNDPRTRSVRGHYLT